MFGKLGDLTNLMKSAKDMQANMAKMQEELVRRRFDAEAGGGMVRATVDGRGMLIDIRIDAKATHDVELLEDLVKASVTAAAAKAQEAMKEGLAALTGGLNIPGLTDMLGGQQ